MKRNEKVVLIVLVLIFGLLLISLLALKIKEKILKEISVLIFLTKVENNETIIFPLNRKIGYCRSIESKIERAIEELLKGPTEEEKKEGISTCLNENTRILNVEVKDKVVNLDFSKEVEEGGGTLLMETRICQIVYTATQFPEVEKVKFLIEGQPINYFSGEGITIVEKPIGREDLKEFEIKIKEEENERENTS